jgi:multidrug transporter EmrE-like cation transporter
MSAYLVVSLIVVVTVVGDYFLKLSANEIDSFRTWQFWLGAALYPLTAAGWMIAMKHLPLATIGVYYSVLTILLLTALGVFVFRETLTGRELLGIGLALTSLGLMAKFS